MIIYGDALTELRKLPDESVHCCVTSPPYWGLRDYGTAKWEGGDTGCDHAPRAQVEGSKTDTNAGALRDKPFNVCPKCGACRIDSQLGLEKTPEEYVAKMVEVFREVKRVLRKDGALWLNLGDSYFTPPAGNKNGRPHQNAYGDNEQAARAMFRASQVKGGHHPTLKHKNLCGIPWRVAFALQADGWYLRSDIIWAKPNPMPESVRDRPTRSHEYIFLMSKNAKYYFDQEAVKEPVAESTVGRGPVDFGGAKGRRYKANIKPEDPNFRGGSEQWGRTFDYTESCKNGRNIRSVWTMTTKPFKEAHFATFPPELPERCIKAGCPVGGTVLDPFFGAGTVGVVAKQLGRDFIGIDLKDEYCKMAERRIAGVVYQMEISA